MTIIEERNPYTVQSTVPIVTWTSSLLPVSKNCPEIVIRVPPALGPLEGVTVWGIGSWWESWRGGGCCKIQHEYILVFPPARILHAHSSSNTEASTHRNNTHRYSVMSYTHTHISFHPLWHTLIQAPHLPQFAEQTVRRSTPLWGSFSGARDMKSQLNGNAVAC